MKLPSKGARVSKRKRAENGEGEIEPLCSTPTQEDPDEEVGRRSHSTRSQIPKKPRRIAPQRSATPLIHNPPSLNTTQVDLTMEEDVFLAFTNESRPLDSQSSRGSSELSVAEVNVLIRQCSTPAEQPCIATPAHARPPPSFASQAPPPQSSPIAHSPLAKSPFRMGTQSPQVSLSTPRQSPWRQQDEARGPEAPDGSNEDMTSLVVAQSALVASLGIASVGPAYTSTPRRSCSTQSISSQLGSKAIPVVYSSPEIRTSKGPLPPFSFQKQAAIDLQHSTRVGNKSRAPNADTSSSMDDEMPVQKSSQPKSVTSPPLPQTIPTQSIKAKASSNTPLVLRSIQPSPATEPPKSARPSSLLRPTVPGIRHSLAFPIQPSISHASLPSSFNVDDDMSAGSTPTLKKASNRLKRRATFGGLQNAPMSPISGLPKIDLEVELQRLRRNRTQIPSYLQPTFTYDDQPSATPPKSAPRRSLSRRRSSLLPETSSASRKPSPDIDDPRSNILLSSRVSDADLDRMTLIGLETVLKQLVEHYGFTEKIVRTIWDSKRDLKEAEDLLRKMRQKANKVALQGLGEA